MNSSTNINDLTKSTQHDEKGDNLKCSVKEVEDKDEDWITEEELDDEEEKEVAEDEEITLLAEIIQGFSSSDPSVRQKATLRAQSLMKEDEELELDLTRKHVSKITNKKDIGCGSGGEADIYTDKKIEIIDFLQDLSPDEFQYRKATRSQRKQKSDGLKKQGNLSFAREEYDEAVQFYSRAIDLIRDCSSLYTNRAFAYIKLGLYELALEDCEKAIFISKFSLKARLYKCKVLQLLQKYEECIGYLEETRIMLPFHKPAIDHCEKTLLGTETQRTEGGSGEKAEDDIFSTEKYMRLASQFQIVQMENFFKKNKPK